MPVTATKILPSERSIKLTAKSVKLDWLKNEHVPYLLAVIGQNMLVQMEDLLPTQVAVLKLLLRHKNLK